MVKVLKEEDFDNNVMESDKCCVVDFFATWCHPCQMLAPVIESVSQEKKDIEFYKVDVDIAQDLAMKYKIEFVPTVIMFKKGKEVGRINGVMDKQDFIKKIEGVF